MVGDYGSTISLNEALVPRVTGLHQSKRDIILLLYFSFFSQGLGGRRKA